jgi:hypothetical protein
VALLRRGALSEYNSFAQAEELIFSVCHLRMLLLGFKQFPDF